MTSDTNESCLTYGFIFEETSFHGEAEVLFIYDVLENSEKSIAEKQCDVFEQIKPIYDERVHLVLVCF